MTRKTILISGASIAGPALAYWMSRYGWDVTVVERAPGLRDAGQNVDIRGAGRTVLHRAGIEAAVRAATTGEQGTQFVDRSGKVVAEFPVRASRTGGFTAELEILRGDLARLLVESDPERVTYMFDNSITQLENLPHEVRVSFQHGAARSFDVVVIAEGKNSRTRPLVFGNAPAVNALGMYTSYFTLPRNERDNDWARWYNAPGGRSMLLRPDNKGTLRATLSFLSEPMGYEDLSEQQQKDVLRETFADAGWEAPRVLDGLGAATDMYFEHLGQVKAPAWIEGRTALVGDAAHCATPISGMGTTLALVGAYVLAGELASHADHRDALRAYERIMRPYVEQAQQLPPGAPRIANPKTRAGIALLHAALRVGSSRVVGVIGAKFSSPSEDDDIELPDYSRLAD